MLRSILLARILVGAKSISHYHSSTTSIPSSQNCRSSNTDSNFSKLKPSTTVAPMISSSSYHLCELFEKYSTELEVHADINTNPRFASNTSLSEAMGYIISMGFSFKAKPDALAASCCANKVVWNVLYFPYICAMTIDEQIEMFKETLESYKLKLQSNPDSTFYKGLVKNTEEYIQEMSEERLKYSEVWYLFSPMAPYLGI